MIRIAPISGDRSAIEALRRSAEREGFRFVDRLSVEWRSGANRFDKPGERLIGAFVGDAAVAICGLNQDPCRDDATTGRLRHLYVLPSSRRRGVATALVGQLLGSARDVRTIRVRAGTPEAVSFYRRLRFTEVTDATATHAIVLR